MGVYNSNIIDNCINASFQWVLSSIRATNGNGSAAGYHFWKGWSDAYPETTGYLIDTLFDGFHLNYNSVYKLAAIKSADWLCRIQLSNGAFPGGVGGKLPPIVFDTGMILFGLTRAWEETNEKKYFYAFSNAFRWLESQICDDFTWQSHSYVPGYEPAYYTMVIWAMLKANIHLKNNRVYEKLTNTLNIFVQKVTPELTILDWGFHSDEPASTHTIGYTLQGMLEAGRMLNNNKATDLVKSIAKKMRIIRQEKGRLAGSYDNKWKGNYSFRCLTGQAQLSLIYFRLYEIYDEGIFLKEARFLFSQTLRFQCRVRIDGLFGGIPGSAPLWGKYQRFYFPNWAVKFFLDAGMTSKKMTNIEGGNIEI